MNPIVSVKPLQGVKKINSVHARTEDDAAQQQSQKSPHPEVIEEQLKIQAAEHIDEMV